MCSNTKKKRVLVLLATGKLGSGIVDAFLSATDKAYDVFCTRDVNHPTLVSKGIIHVQFSYGDTHSMKRALEISTPSILIVITAFQIAKSLEKEFIMVRLFWKQSKKWRIRRMWSWGCLFRQSVSFKEQKDTRSTYDYTIRLLSCSCISFKIDCWNCCCSNFLQSISWVLGVVKSFLYIRWNNLKRKLAWSSLETNIDVVPIGISSL